jgi:PAS domain S-box-containing protein
MIPANNPKFDYELFFQLSPDLLCMAGFDGYFKKINPALSILLGYSLEELYSRPINTFVHPKDQQITSQVRTELTRAKPLFNFENRYITKSGEIVWLSWTSFPVEKDRLVFAIAKNITHKKNIEASRNELLTNLTKMNSDLKQITYMTSHDLRSPVSSLLSIFTLLDFSKVKDTETLELLDFLKLATEQLKETLDSYVDLLSEKHRDQSSLEDINLNETLQKVMLTIDNLLKSSNTNIQIDFSEIENVKFNKAYLHSVFLNLISNSIKYAKPDEPPMISIHSKRENGFDRIIYTDNGMGFDMEEVKEKLFGMHEKFHHSSDSKGIGLYLVHSHMHSLGGKIEIESSINNGATFTLLFRNHSRKRTLKYTESKAVTSN